MNITTKSEAVNIFGSQAELARAIGVTRGAIGQWGEKLTERQINEVTGAAIRKGLISPCDSGDQQLCDIA